MKTLSVVVESFSQLVKIIEEWQSKIQQIELRLDMNPSLDWARVRKLIDVPIIVTCMPAREGGVGQLIDTQRQEILKQAIAAGCEMLDLPHDESIPAWAIQVPIIHSWHQASSTEIPTHRLADIYQQLARKARPNDFVKIVTYPNNQQAALSVMKLYELNAASPNPNAGLLAFAQGQVGAWTRLAALKMGSPWIYCGTPQSSTAPGQMSLDYLDELPFYDLPNTQFWGVLGSPIAHSRSPLLWNKAFAAENKNAIYVAVECDNLAGFLEQSPQGFWQGFSVTSPLKQQAANFVDTACECSHSATALNTLLREPEQGAWFGINTDGLGALAALRKKGMPESANILVLGGGGAARAFMAEAQRQGLKISCGVRTPSKLSKFAKEVDCELFSLDDLNISDYKVVVQATAVGTSSKEELNIDLNFKPGQLVLEMHYSPVITNFLAAAINHGAVPCFGSQMLYQQMIAQYRAGVSPNPDAKMLTSLEQHLAANLPGSPPIILCGPRASGKTSLGRALAAQLGRRFFDADELLEKRNQIKISDWIPKNLESFRDAESELLEELVQYQDAVLALGGGVVERDNNRELLARQSAVYYLNAEHQTLLHRQSSQPRPALTDKNLSDEITLLSQRRHPWYMQAAKDRIIATDGDFETVLSLLHNMVS